MYFGMARAIWRAAGRAGIMKQDKGLRRLLRRATPAQIFALVFLGIILLGAGLLTLPFASRSGVSCGFGPALFTATSATCVTGLVVYDTYVQWSAFGQIIIIMLIQIGGLGFMSVASIFYFMSKRKMGMRYRMLISQSMSVDSLSGVIRLQKHVLFGTLGFEGAGALALTLYFWKDYGAWRAIRWGVFHSVSAFCNAGFDIFGCLTPGGSLVRFSTDPVVCLVLGFLVIVGGLGFFVWEDVFRARRWKRLTVYSKLVLLSSLVLLAGGTAMIGLFEWNNPSTLGPMTVPQKLLAAFFQSVTTRTAGFAAINQAGLTQGGKAASILLMLVGGSSGSTAGGLKTVTVCVLLLATANQLRGRTHIRVFDREIPAANVRDASALAVMMGALSILGSLVLVGLDGVSFLDGWYETASAIATVGLTAGLTPSLCGISKALLIVYMYFGRVGLMTISLGFLAGNEAQERFRLAQTRLMIG